MCHVSKLRVAALLLVALTVLTLVCLLGGCTKLMQWDAALWGSPATPALVHPDGSITPAQPGTPGAAPPIIEGIAAVLSILGFGGMARWISSIKQNGTKTATELADRIDTHAATVDDVAGRVKELEGTIKLLTAALQAPRIQT